MGGASSEITDATTEVLLEAAYFTPMAVARTSKRLGLRTEASARFERGCDPGGSTAAVDRFCRAAGARARPALLASAMAARRRRRRCPSPSRSTVPHRPGAAPIWARPDATPMVGAARAHRVRAARAGGDGHPAWPPDQPARRPPGALWGRRRHRGGGPAPSATRTCPAHAQLARSRAAHRPPARPPPGQGRPVRAGRLRGAGRTRSSPRRTPPGRAHRAGRGVSQPAVAEEPYLRRSSARPAAGPGLQRRPAPGRDPAVRGGDRVLAPRRGGPPAGRPQRGRGSGGPRCRASASCSRASSPATTTTPGRLVAWRVPGDALGSTGSTGAPGRG